MRIGQRLFRFPVPALIIAVNAERARLLTAHDGLLLERERIQLAKPKIEGRKPLLKRSGRGLALKIGGPERTADHTLTFTPLLARVNAAGLRELKAGAQEVYLFAPRHLLNEARQRLHSDLRRRVIRAFPLDVVHEHPRILVERLTQDRLPSS